MARRLNRDEQQRILDAYEAYDPDAGDTIDDLLEGLGVSRQTLYTTLGRAGVAPKTRREVLSREAMPATGAAFTADILETMADAALNRLFARLSELEQENARLRGELTHLEERGGRGRIRGAPQDDEG